MLRARLVIGCWFLAVTIFVDSAEEPVGEEGGEGGVDGPTERSEIKDGVETSKEKETGKVLNNVLSVSRKGMELSANDNVKTRSGEIKANMDASSVGEEKSRGDKEIVDADQIKGHSVKNINELEKNSKVSNNANNVIVKLTETNKSSVTETATQVTTEKSGELKGRGLGFGGPQGIPFGATKDRRQEYVFGAGRGLGVGSLSSTGLYKSTLQGQVFGAGRGLGFRSLSSTGRNKSRLEGQVFGAGRGGLSATSLSSTRENKSRLQGQVFGAGRGLGVGSLSSTGGNKSRLEGQVFGAGRGLGVGLLSSTGRNKSRLEWQVFGAGRGLGVGPLKPLSTGLNKSRLEGKMYGRGRGLGFSLSKGRLREEVYGGSRGLGFGGVPNSEKWRGRVAHNRLGEFTRGQEAGGFRYAVNKSWVDPFMNRSRIKDLNEYYRLQSVQFGTSNRSDRPEVGVRIGINGTRVGINGSGILERLGAGRGVYVGGRLGGGGYSGMRIMAGAVRRRMMGNATAGALPESGWARLGGVGARLGDVGLLREAERGRFGGARIGERGRIGSAGRFVGRREWEWGAGRFAVGNGTRRGVLGGAGGFGGIRRFGWGRFGGGLAREAANGTGRGFGRGGFGGGFEGIRRGGFGGFGGGRLGLAVENGTAGGLRGFGMGARGGFASGRFVPGVGKPGDPSARVGPGVGFGRGGARPNLFGRVGVAGRGTGALGRVRSGAGAPPPGAGRGKFGIFRGRFGFSRPGFRAGSRRRGGRFGRFRYGRKPRRRQTKAKTQSEVKRITYHLLRNAKLQYPSRARSEQPYEIQLKKLRTAMLLAQRQKQAVVGEERVAGTG